MSTVHTNVKHLIFHHELLTNYDAKNRKARPQSTLLDFTAIFEIMMFKWLEGWKEFKVVRAQLRLYYAIPCKLLKK